MAATDSSAIPSLPGGVYTAIVTPFTADGKSVDFGALESLVEAQIAGGVAGVVPVRPSALLAWCGIRMPPYDFAQCGTTGESPTLSVGEKQAIITAVVKTVAGRCLVVAGTGAARPRWSAHWRRAAYPPSPATGSNNTADTLTMTTWAKDVGVDACLLVTPYYNKPSQHGIIAHVTAVADLGLPVLLYNIPGRSGVKMTAETIAALAVHPCVVGVKEACGSVGMVSDIAEAVHPLRPDFAILSGDGSL